MGPYKDPCRPTLRGVMKGCCDQTNKDSIDFLQKGQVFVGLTSGATKVFGEYQLRDLRCRKSLTTNLQDCQHLHQTGGKYTTRYWSGWHINRSFSNRYSTFSTPADWCRPFRPYRVKIICFASKTIWDLIRDCILLIYSGRSLVSIVAFVN